MLKNTFFCTFAVSKLFVIHSIVNFDPDSYRENYELITLCQKIYYTK